MANKVIDINSQYGGRSDYANQLNYEYFINKYDALRSPKISVKKLFKPTDVSRLPEFIISTYKLKGLEFGNWVNQVRRLDYCLSTIIAFYDLQKILQFKNNNLGIDKSISIAYGARGISRAAAHYEPLTNVINLSRDRRIDKVKGTFSNMPLAVYKDSSLEEWNEITNKMRAYRSGYGSIAHEYGHALDYILAKKYTKGRSTALSGGSSVISSYNRAGTAYTNFIDSVYDGKNTLNELENSFLHCFMPFLFTKGKPTGFYRRVYNYAAKTSEYWARHNEIWARIFETYIAYKLFKAGIKDGYLVSNNKGKYRAQLGKNAIYVYPTFGEMGKNYKKIDQFIDIARNYV